MIKQVKTEEEYKKCIEFLSKWNLKTLPGTSLFYCDTEAGIKAVAGWNKNLGCQIEPFASESIGESYKLFYFMLGLIKGLGYDYVTAQPIEKLLENQLISHGFQIYLTGQKLIMEL